MGGLAGRGGAQKRSLFSGVSRFPNGHHARGRREVASRESFLSGMALYAQRPDKGYSLTDCISMAAMHREGLDEALTNDRHFEQEGFRALFRET